MSGRLVYWRVGRLVFRQVRVGAAARARLFGAQWGRGGYTICVADIGATHMSAAPTALAEVQEDICSLPLMDVPYRLPGKWDDEAYLTLAESVRRLVEMTDGVVEVMPPPTMAHQHMLGWLFEAFRRHIADAGGMVVFSPVPLRIRERNYREPDLIFWCNANDPRLEAPIWMVRTSSLRSSALAAPSAISWTSDSTTPKPGFPSTGSWIRATKLGQC